MKINPVELPEFEMMIAGFPCQTFSVMGQRKWMEDPRWQIIYGLIKIMKAKNLKYFILENVKGLVNHDNWNSLEVILKALDEAWYKVYHQVLNSIDYGVPQMRERIYFIGVRKDIIGDDFIFQFPTKQAPPNLDTYLMNPVELSDSEKKEEYTSLLRYLENKYNSGQCTIEDILEKENSIIDIRQSDLRIYNNKSPTLRAGRHGLLYVQNKRLKKLSWYEALLLQGFPRYLAERVSGTIPEAHLLKQTGNAMTVTTIEALARQLIISLKSYEYSERTSRNDSSLIPNC